jgi:hypothetical protein
VNLKILSAVVVGSSMVVSGCSSRPRAFAPTLAAPPAEQGAFLVAGKLDRDGRLASAAGGAAAGGAGAAVGGATAAAVAGYGGMAVVAATVVLLPLAVVGGAVGMAKAKRAKKERAIKSAMTGCLKERGYAVNGWTRMSKADIKAAEARARLATAAPAPATAN